MAVYLYTVYIYCKFPVLIPVSYTKAIQLMPYPWCLEQNYDFFYPEGGSVGDKIF